MDRTSDLNLYDYGARNYDAIIGRWTTMDPLAERTPEVSPYVYCKDNPINAIDIGGDSIYYYRDLGDNEKGNSIYQRYLYKEVSPDIFNFIDYKGDIVKDEYGLNLISALEMLNSGENGKELISYLRGTKKNNVDIISSVTNFTDNNTMGEITVYWNDKHNGCGPNEVGNLTAPSFITLGHEFYHAEHIINGSVNNMIWFGAPGLNSPITMEEYYTSIEENKLRLEHHIPLRTHYLNYSGTSVGVEATRLDLPNWRPVFPFNWK